jgi:sarcosine oxidase subunit alpha
MEKGFLHIGTDTDHTTVPDDIGLGKIASAKPIHYVGKRSLSLLDNMRSDRLQLVGLAGVNASPLPVGSHLRSRGTDHSSDGWVTSAGLLSTDGTPAALAMLKAGRSQLGRIVTVHDGGEVVNSARVVNPVFYDPAGRRMNA